MKKLLVLLVSFLLLLTMVGCSGKNTETSQTTDDNTTDVVEARTAIVFKEIDGTSATIKRNGTSESSYEGMRLLADDEIITDANTSIYLRVDDDKNILLDKDSSMSISELKDGKLKLKLNYGEFFFEVINKLSDGEDVSFDIGSTTMSIRGTSGAGRLRNEVTTVSLYTGKGYVEGDNGFSVDISPNTMLTSDVSGGGTFSMSNVVSANVSGVAAYYFENNPDYQKKVENSTWAKALKGEDVEESSALTSQPALTGWRQLADGTWVYDDELAQADQASAFYNTPTPATPLAPATKPGAKPIEKPTENTENEPIKPTVKEVLPCGHLKESVKAGEAGKHELIKYAQAYLASIDPMFVEVDFSEACGNHYLCHLDLTTDSDGHLTEGSLNAIFAHIYPCSSCGELECSSTFLDHHTIDNGECVCNRTITVKFVDGGNVLKTMTVYPSDFIGGVLLPVLENTSDKKFVGFSTDNTHIRFTVSQDGEFATLKPGDKLTTLAQYSEITFTAVWEDITPTSATVTLNGNGGKFSNNESTVKLSLPSEVEASSVNDLLAKNELSLQNGDYHLVGWRTGDEKVHSSDEQFITSSTGVLDAVWGHKVTFVVYDEQNQAIDQETVLVADGKKVSVPEKYAETSLRWFKDGVAFNFDTPINSDTTLNGYYPS